MLKLGLNEGNYRFHGSKKTLGDKDRQGGIEGPRAIKSVYSAKRHRGLETTDLAHVCLRKSSADLSEKGGQELTRVGPRRTRGKKVALTGADFEKGKPQKVS